MKSYKQIMDDLIKNTSHMSVQDLQPGSALQSLIETNKGEEVSHQLRKLLAKLNIKSARSPFIEDLVLRSIKDFGTPDQLYISPSLLDAFKKAFGDKE